MSRYIDADKFITTIDSSDELDAYSAITVCNLIENAHKADVVEVVHGEWIKICWKAFRCSECKQISEYYTDFCPKCGADMRKEVEE